MGEYREKLQAVVKQTEFDWDTVSELAAQEDSKLKAGLFNIVEQERMQGI